MLPQATRADIWERIGQKRFNARRLNELKQKTQGKGSSTAKKRAMRKDFQLPSL